MSSRSPSLSRKLCPVTKSLGGRRGDGSQHHASRQARKPVERLQALGNDVLVRREHVVRQALPVRQGQNGQVAGVEADLVFQSLGGEAADGNNQQGPVAASSGRRDG